VNAGRPNVLSLRDFPLGQSWRVSRLPWVRGVTSTLRFVPPSRSTTSASTSTNYQLATKLFITSWIDGLIWINPSLQHNYVGPDLFPHIQEYKAQYVFILLDSTEHIVHVESSSLPTKVDLILGLRFLSDLTYTTTDHALSIKINE